MEDKTPFYMLGIVVVVALVGLIVVFSNTASKAPVVPATSQDSVQTDSGDNALTGNVIGFNSGNGTKVNVTAILQIFFVAFLIGMATYLYFEK